jgi:hypothetical protein
VGLVQEAPRPPGGKDFPQKQVVTADEVTHFTNFAL